MKKQKILGSIIILVVIILSAVLLANGEDLFPEPDNSSSSSESVDLSDNSGESSANDSTEQTLNEEFMGRENYRAEKIASGEIPADTPRITREQADAIINDPKIDQIIRDHDFQGLNEDGTPLVLEQFNEIAGYYDFYSTMWGDGCYIYGIEDTCNEYIAVCESTCKVYYWKGTDYSLLGKAWRERMEASQPLRDKVNSRLKTFDGKPIYEYYYEKATDEQKAKLEPLKEKISYDRDNYGYQQKKMMQAIGELPEDTPQLTFEQVKAICTSEKIVKLYNEYKNFFPTTVEEEYEKMFKAYDLQDALIAEFDKIAGAPDIFEEYSNRVYFLDDDEIAYIRVYFDVYAIPKDKGIITINIFDSY